MEKWKIIPEFNGAFSISDEGRLKANERDITDRLGRVTHKKERIIKGRLDEWGYVSYQFSFLGKHYNKRAHRLVAENFIKKVNGKSQVNHIDGNKTNNNVDNLEWCTNRENVVHAYNLELNKAAKPIYQYDCDGTFIKRWTNSMEIQRTLGICAGTIKCACERENHFTKGYYWKYEVDNER